MSESGSLKFVRRHSTKTHHRCVTPFGCQSLPHLCSVFKICLQQQHQLFLLQTIIMANTIAQKLRIKEGMKLRTLHSPPNFEQGLQPLPPDVTVVQNGKNYDQLHWFVTNKSQLEKEVEMAIELIRADVVCWAYYPKATSKIQTDLTRDKGWDTLLHHNELQWISLISFDETWSTFGFRLKTEADKKKEAKPKEREIFNYIDAKAKTINLPDDFTSALKKNKQASEYFNTLSFTNKKEYVEWIVTAKREETRLQRIEGSIERLLKRWKNPRNM